RCARAAWGIESFPAAARKSTGARFRRVRRDAMAAPMQEKFTALTPALYDYLVAHNPPPDPVLRDLAAETKALGPISRMQIAVEQGALLTFLARLLGARRALAVGTFTGYPAIPIA